MLKVHLGPRDKVKKCDTVINCCIMEYKTGPMESAPLHYSSTLFKL